MRHRKLSNQLGLNSSHRSSVLRNLATSLFQNGRIKTTKARGKALRVEIDRLIGLIKKGDLHSRRKLHSYLYSKPLVYDLINIERKYFESRESGFLKITKANFRAGDNAEMVYVEILKDDPEKINQGVAKIAVS